MSTIKIGDRVVQTTDRSGRIRGGIDSGSRLDQNPRRTKSDTQIVQDQIKKIKDIEQQFKGVDDNRSKFLALSTPKAIFEDAQNRRIQNRRRAQILDDLKTGKNVNRSEFTGREPKPGTKNSILTAFGIGTVPTGRSKLREGLTSSEYADFMRQAYQANPGMMESLFPFASGKMIRNVSRLAPGIGTLQNLASAAKEKTGGFLNRFFPGLLPSSGIATTKQAQPTLAELAENAFRFASFRTAPTNIKDIKADNYFDKRMNQLQAIKLFSGFPATVQSQGLFTNFEGTPMISSDPNVTSLFDPGAVRFKSDTDAIDQIIKQSKTPPDIDVFPGLRNFTPSEQMDAVRGFKSLRGIDTIPFPTLDQFQQIREQSKTPPDIDVSMEGIAPVKSKTFYFNTPNNLNQTGSTLTGLPGNASIAQQKEFFERAIRGNAPGVPDRIGEIYQNLLDSGVLSSSEALQYGSFVRNLPPPSNTYGLNPNIKPGIEAIDLQGNFPGVL